MALKVLMIDWDWRSSQVSDMTRSCKPTFDRNFFSVAFQGWWALLLLELSESSGVVTLMKKFKIALNVPQKTSFIAPLCLLNDLLKALQSAWLSIWELVLWTSSLCPTFRGLRLDCTKSCDRIVLTELQVYGRHLFFLFDFTAARVCVFIHVDFSEQFNLVIMVHNRWKLRKFATVIVWETGCDVLQRLLWSLRWDSRRALRDLLRVEPTTCEEDDLTFLANVDAFVYHYLTRAAAVAHTVFSSRFRLLLLFNNAKLKDTSLTACQWPWIFLSCFNHANSFCWVCFYTIKIDLVLY